MCRTVFEIRCDGGQWMSGIRIKLESVCSSKKLVPAPETMICDAPICTNPLPSVSIS